MQKNVVEAASAFLKISQNTFKSKDFLHDNNEFYFDCIYFMEPASIKRFAKDNIDCDIFTLLSRGRSCICDDFYDYDKIVTTYTNLDEFMAYIKEIPITEHDLYQNIVKND